MFDWIHPAQSGSTGRRDWKHPAWGFPSTAGNRWVGWPARFDTRSFMSRPAVIVLGHRSPWATGKQGEPLSSRSCHETTRLLTSRGALRYVDDGAAKCHPVSMSFHRRGCPWGRPRRHPFSGCQSGLPANPQPVRRQLSKQSCMGRGPAANDLLSKANRPGWRHGSAHPIERQTYEKGNVDQRIAGGRMPDCDC